MRCPGCGREGRPVETMDGRPPRAGACNDDDCSVRLFAGNVILTRRGDLRTRPTAAHTEAVSRPGQSA